MIFNDVVQRHVNMYGLGMFDSFSSAASMHAVQDMRQQLLQRSALPACMLLRQLYAYDRLHALLFAVSPLLTSVCRMPPIWHACHVLSYVYTYDVLAVCSLCLFIYPSGHRSGS